MPPPRRIIQAEPFQRISTTLQHPVHLEVIELHHIPRKDVATFLIFKSKLLQLSTLVQIQIEIGLKTELVQVCRGV